MITAAAFQRVRAALGVIAEDDIVWATLCAPPADPLLPGQIIAHAEALGTRLMVALCQLSFTVETPTSTRWFSRRQEPV